MPQASNTASAAPASVDRRWKTFAALTGECSLAPDNRGNTTRDMPNKLPTQVPAASMCAQSIHTASVKSPWSAGCPVSLRVSAIAATASAISQSAHE